MTKGIRLNFIVEGQTEETFANRILSPHLANHRVWASVRMISTRSASSRRYKGGVTRYARVKKDLSTWMRQDGGEDARFTTMFDLYQLPNDFPGYEKASHSLDPYERVNMLEDSLAEDIGDSRLIPYIQLHEFEALLLSDPRKLNAQFNDSDAIERLAVLVSKFDSPELIDDGMETAPSKRIFAEIPEYSSVKPSAGPLAAQRIGLQTMRAKCKHFGEWLTRLESLAG